MLRNLNYQYILSLLEVVKFAWSNKIQLILDLIAANMDLIYKAKQHFSSNNKTISFNRFKKNQSKNVSKMLVSKTIGFG